MADRVRKIARTLRRWWLVLGSDHGDGTDHAWESRGWYVLCTHPECDAQESLYDRID